MNWFPRVARHRWAGCFSNDHEDQYEGREFSLTLFGLYLSFTIARLDQRWAK